MRTAKIERETKETEIKLELNLDGSGKSKIDTPIKFLNHMLENFSKHSGFDLKITATGDTEVEDHHLVEDIGISLGHAIDKALKDKIGISRMGHAIVPLDDALTTVAVDLSGRGYAKVEIFEEYEFEISEKQLVEEVEKFLNEKGLKILERKRYILGCIIDFLCEDKEKNIVVVVVKKEKVDKWILDQVNRYLDEAIKEKKKKGKGIIISGGKTADFENFLTKSEYAIDVKDWRISFGFGKLSPRIGDLTKETIPHFFEALALNGKFNLHIKSEGKNDHHKVESCFKALARALHDATRITGKGVPSTKGVI